MAAQPFLDRLWTQQGLLGQKMEVAKSEPHGGVVPACKLPNAHFHREASQGPVADHVDGCGALKLWSEAAKRVEPRASCPDSLAGKGIGV